MKKLISILTVLCLVVGIGAVTASAADDYTIVSPYSDVIWEGDDAWDAYKGSNYAILIPAGTWHNIVNVGKCPLKLYSLYAPPQHPFGTVHRTKEDAEH